MKYPGIYIHFPFCRKKCAYCAFYSLSGRDELYDKYIKSLLRELQKIDFFVKQCPADTLYFGGGTPSLLKIEDLAKIMEQVCHGNFREITLEVNPATTDEEKIRDYRKLGIDRISIGVQSLDAKTLEFLGRIHGPKQAIRTIDFVEKYFDKFSVDIIYAVPEFSCSETVKAMAKRRVPHISTYCLSVEPKTPLYARGTKTSDEQFRREYTFLHEYLQQHGYHHYEVSNFALPGKEGEHNLKYWDRTPYLGIGPAAHSLWNERRFCFDDLEDFADSSLEEKYRQSRPLTPDEIREENIMLAARTDGGVPLELLSAEVQKSLNHLIIVKNEKVIPSLEGWMVLDSLILKMI